MQGLMKAAIVHEFGKPLLIENVPIPVPGPGELLVKVAACGVCHTDLHAASGDWPVKPSLPFIPGHEGAGIVAAVGPGVVGLKEGDAVGTAHAPPFERGGLVLAAVVTDAVAHLPGEVQARAVLLQHVDDA